jgi:hypothetical protein
MMVKYPSRLFLMDLTKTDYHDRQYVTEAYTDTAKYCSSA